MLRLRNLELGAYFTLKRTGDRYQFLSHKRDTPGGTRYVVRRSGFAGLTTLHPSCQVELIDSAPTPGQSQEDGR